MRHNLDCIGVGVPKLPCQPIARIWSAVYLIIFCICQRFSKDRARHKGINALYCENKSWISCDFADKQYSYASQPFDCSHQSFATAGVKIRLHELSRQLEGLQPELQNAAATAVTLSTLQEGVTALKDAQQAMQVRQSALLISHNAEKAPVHIMSICWGAVHPLQSKLLSEAEDLLKVFHFASINSQYQS